MQLARILPKGKITAKKVLFGPFEIIVPFYPFIAPFIYPFIHAFIDSGRNGTFRGTDVMVFGQIDDTLGNLTIMLHTVGGSCWLGKFVARDA